MSVVVAEGVVEITADAEGVPAQVGRQIDGGAGHFTAAGGRSGTSFFGGMKGVLLGGAILGGMVGIGASIGSAITEGIGSAISSGITYIEQSIGLASDLAETGTAINAIFGEEMTTHLNTWSKNAVTDLGQSQQSALNAAKTFGVFGTAAELTGADLFNFSTDLTGLATDLASFHNRSPEDAILALGAGLRGEMEPLRSFGIMLDDASLRAKALEMGIYSGNGALNDQQKVLAANALMFEKAGPAIGDFERTSGGLANQQRQLSAALEQAQTSLGTALLPAITTLATFANENLVPILNEVIEQIGPLLGDALTAAAPSIMELVESFAELLPTLIEMGIEVLPTLVDLFALLVPLFIDSTENTTQLWAILGGFLGFLTGDTSLAEFGEDVAKGGGTMMEFARVIVGALQGSALWFANFVTGAKTNIGDFLASVGAIPGNIIAALSGAGSWLVQTGRDIVQGLINGVMGMVRNAVKSVTDLGGAMLGGIKNFLGIRSPSVRFELEVGEQMGEGVIRGWEKKLDKWRGGLTADLNLGGVDASAAGRAVASSASAGDIHIGTVTLDAHNVDDFMRIVELVRALPQVSRTGRGIRLAG